MNRACNEIDRLLAPRTRWELVVIWVCVAYLVARIIPWAFAGFPVVGK